MLQRFVENALGIHLVYSDYTLYATKVCQDYTGNTSGIHRIAIYHVSKLSVPVSQMASHTQSLWVRWGFPY